MTTAHLAAAVCIGVAAAALAGMVVRPAPRLAGRLRPYLGVARASRPGAPAGAEWPAAGAVVSGATIAQLVGPPVRAVAHTLGRVVESRSDDALATLLYRAASDTNPETFRVRQVARGALVGALAGAASATLLGTPVVTLLAVLAGFTFGATRERRRIEHAVEVRAARMRAELYTVNQLLALHLRAGAGPIQAVQRVVARGRGAVVDELATVLGWIRNGTSEPEAFRRAAALTPEPSAARTYQLIATGSERGADLGAALLAYSEDIRDARRQQVHKDAVRRRAAMLVPTIAILAPIMLLFIAAPLPSIVLGQR